MAWTYPESKQVDHTDDYHGTQVADPFRWLEAPAHTSEVAAWIELQNDLTQGYLKGLPMRKGLEARLTELWDYPKSSAPFKRGGRYFQFRNSGLQNQDVLYVMDTPQAEGAVLLDPNSLSEDGTAALNTMSVSPDGRHLAYAVAERGSDWVTWRVRSVETGADLPDTLVWSRFSGATWLPDSSGFFYKRYPTPEPGQEYVAALENAQLMLHYLGQVQPEDEVVYTRPDKPRWSFHPVVSDDKRYLVLYITRGTERRNLIYYRPLSGGVFTELIGDWNAEYQFLGNDGDTFYFRTDLDADRGRVVAVELDQPEPTNWHTLIPQSENTLEAVNLVGDTFICLYLHHAASRLHTFATDGTPRGDIGLPGLGSVAALNAEREDDEMFYSHTSFLTPPTPYRHDLKTGRSARLRESTLDFDAAAYITRQVFVKSKDGTQVPMFLVHRKNLEATGENPTLLYGYGGFNIALTPSFSVSRLVWLEAGGVLAVANLRGGGEYGRAWHEAGTLSRKQNVFDDFIACTEWLTEAGITRPERLAIQGGSNGGLLVGAAMTQRPELYGAALPAVGVMDMLRFHQFTIGWAWTSDYGSADESEQFPTLYAYSPLHNLKPGTRYPATLVTTGDHDDRVVPAHSFKFAAALQAAQAGDAPVLIRVQTKTGHGLGKPTRLIIEEQADIWAFAMQALNMGD